LDPGTGGGLLFFYKINFQVGINTKFAGGYPIFLKSEYFSLVLIPNSNAKSPGITLNPILWSNENTQDHVKSNEESFYEFVDRLFVAKLAVNRQQIR